MWLWVLRGACITVLVSTGDGVSLTKGSVHGENESNDRLTTSTRNNDRRIIRYDRSHDLYGLVVAVVSERHDFTAAALAKNSQKIQRYLQALRCKHRVQRGDEGLDLDGLGVTELDMRESGLVSGVSIGVKEVPIGVKEVSMGVKEDHGAINGVQGSKGVHIGHIGLRTETELCGERPMCEAAAVTSNHNGTIKATKEGVEAVDEVQDELEVEDEVEDELEVEAAMSVRDTHMSVRGAQRSYSTSQGERRLRSAARLQVQGR